MQHCCRRGPGFGCTLPPRVKALYLRWQAQVRYRHGRLQQVIGRQMERKVPCAELGGGQGQLGGGGGVGTANVGWGSATILLSPFATLPFLGRFDHISGNASYRGLP